MEVDQLPPDPKPGRWVPLERVTKRTSAGFLGNGWDPELNHADLKVLVIGAGGLGCEILKNLALSGFRDIDVIDMDTIDLSNLNRQFLFRLKDVHKPKATVAAEFVMQRVPGVRVTPHFGKIEDKPDSFYLGFQIVILGLDSLHARQWMNDKICSLIVWEDKGGKFAVANADAIPPIIDGGTEGFKGHIRMIRPTLTASFNSTMWMFPPQVAFPMCTLESVPRLPEHCVAYIKEKVWEDEKPFDGAKLDGDSTEHIQWITQRAQERADKFGIKGVDYRFTQGVVKNIIPAIASTNAVVSAGCVLEALKIATGASRQLKNYTVYNGSSIDQGIYCQTQNLLPEPDDHQAGPPTIVEIGADWTVERFLSDGVVAQYETETGRKLKKPEQISVRTAGGVGLVARGMMADTTAAKWTKPLLDFVDLDDPFESIIHIRSAELSEDPNVYGKIKLRVV